MCVSVTLSMRAARRAVCEMERVGCGVVQGGVAWHCVCSYCVCVCVRGLDDKTRGYKLHLPSYHPPPTTPSPHDWLRALLTPSPRPPLHLHLLSLPTPRLHPVLLYLGVSACGVVFVVFVVLLCGCPCVCVIVCVLQCVCACVFLCVRRVKGTTGHNTWRKDPSTRKT